MPDLAPGRRPYCGQCLRGTQGGRSRPAVDGQRQLSFKLQLVAVMLDSTGLCLVARPPVVADPQLMVDMLNGRFGWGWSTDDLDHANRDALRIEIEFNRRAG